MLSVNARQSLVVLAMLLALGTAGCGGFSASHSVSPSSFLLPSLGQVEMPTEEVIPSPRLVLSP